jgi:Mor family transcriptional regulator
MNNENLRPISAWENDLADVIGVEALIKLERRYGHMYVYIKANEPAEQMIETIGEEAAQKLTEHYGCTDIYVPCTLLRKLRNEEIEQAVTASGKNPGKTIHELAAKFRITTKRIKDILRERGVYESINTRKQ